MKETVYYVQKIDWRNPMRPCVMSTYTSTDYESARDEFMKSYNSENCTTVETKHDSIGDFQVFWIGSDFCVVFMTNDDGSKIKSVI